MIKSVLFSSTARDSYKLFIGNFVSSVCGFLIITLLTRNSAISAGDIGLFITALTFTQLVSDLFELGINPASINFLSKGDRSYLKASFILKLSVATIVSIGTFIFSSQIASLVFKDDTMIPFIQVSAMGIGFLLLLNWAQTIFQTEKKFGWASIVISSTNVFRFLAVSLSLLTGVTSIYQNYLIFHFVLIFSLVIFFWKFGFKFLSFKSSKEQLQKILRFGLPTGLGFGVAAIYTRLDQIFVFRIAGQQEAADYGLASRLIIIIIFAVTAFNSAIVIRFVSLEKERFLQYFKKTYLAILGLVGLLIINILIAPFIVPLLFGAKFNSAILPFQILTIGIIFFCLALPLQDAILYRHKKPIFSFWISLFSLGLVLVLLQYLIPVLGSKGAAIAMSVTYFIQLLISVAYYWKIKND